MPILPNNFDPIESIPRSVSLFHDLVAGYFVSVAAIDFNSDKRTPLENHFCKRWRTPNSHSSLRRRKLQLEHGSAVGRAGKNCGSRDLRESNQRNGYGFDGHVSVLLSILQKSRCDDQRRNFCVVYKGNVIWEFRWILSMTNRISSELISDLTSQY